MSAFLLLVLASCAVPWSDGDRRGVYPHPKEYEALAAHGADAVRDPETCATCHGRGAPECTECPIAGPHQPPAGATHAPTNADCADCHEAAAAVAAERAPCNRCHPSYPHAEGWEGAERHGLYALERQRPDLVCGNCHGADLAGVGDAKGCASCHEAWPHASNWTDVHGPLAAADPASCVGCHGDHGEGGPSGAACTTCHLGIPHPEGWNLGHLEAAATVGEASCLRCHAPADGSPEVHATCAVKCHGGAP